MYFRLILVISVWMFVVEEASGLNYIKCFNLKKADDVMFEASFETENQDAVLMHLNHLKERVPQLGCKSHISDAEFKNQFRNLGVSVTNRIKRRSKYPPNGQSHYPFGRQSHYPSRRRSQYPSRGRSHDISDEDYVDEDEYPHNVDYSHAVVGYPCRFQRIRHSLVKCDRWTELIMCDQVCSYGHGRRTAKGTKTQLKVVCERFTGYWRTGIFRDCKPFINCEVTLKEGREGAVRQKRVPYNEPPRYHVTCDFNGTTLYTCSPDFEKTLPSCVTLKKIDLLSFPEDWDHTADTESSSTELVVSTTAKSTTVKTEESREEDDDFIIVDDDDDDDDDEYEDN